MTNLLGPRSYSRGFGVFGVAMRQSGRLEKGLRRLVGRAIGDFGLIEHGDRILVALSGGKDSWTLLHILALLRDRAPINYSLVAVTVHPGFPGFHTEAIEQYLAENGIEHRVVSAPIHEAMLSLLRPDDNPCSLCARLRRGVLYTTALEMGCSKIALGHHREDFIETLLLNLLYNGRIKAMAPILKSDDGMNTVIRPLVYVPEEDTLSYAREKGFPVTCCACPACGDSDMKRLRIKRLLSDLEREQPGIKTNILSALGRVEMRHLVFKKADMAVRRSL